MVSRPSSRSNSFHRQNSFAKQQAASSMLASEALKRLMTATPGNAPLNSLLPKTTSKSGSKASEALFHLGSSLSSTGNSSKHRSNSSGGLLMPLTPLVPLVPLTRNNNTGSSSNSLHGRKSTSSGQLMQPLAPLGGQLLQPLVPLAVSRGPTSTSTTTHSSPASDALKNLIGSSSNAISTPASDALDDYLRESNARGKKTKCHMTASPGSSNSLNKLLGSSNSMSSLKRKSTGSLTGTLNTSFTTGGTGTGSRKSTSFTGGLCNFAQDDYSSNHDLPGMLPPWATLDYDEDEDNCPPLTAGSLPPWTCAQDDEAMMMPPPAPVSPAAQPRRATAYDMTDLFNATQMEDVPRAALEFPAIGAAFPEDDDDDYDDAQEQHSVTHCAIPTLVHTAHAESRGRSKSFNSLQPQRASSRDGRQQQLIRSKTLREIHRILSNHAMQRSPVVVPKDDDVFNFCF